MIPQRRPGYPTKLWIRGWPRGDAGWIAVFYGFALLLSVLLLVLLRLLYRTGAMRIILDPLAGVIVVAAIPASSLVTSRLPFVPNRVMMSELVLACGLILLTRKARVRYVVPLLVLHYAAWAWLLIAAFAWRSVYIPLVLPPYLVSLVGGALWVVYAHRTRSMMGAGGSL